MYCSSDPVLNDKIAEWLKWDENENTRKQLLDFVEKEDFKTLGKLLLQRLEFGTAGLRGVMRTGYNSMNDLVILQTAQGLCTYILQQYPTKEHHHHGIVLGYDGRYNSKRFAEITANIFIRKGVKVWLYSRMVPTPFVPFAIRQLKCLAGVMVTASHNPKDDNGYKVYWSNGAQIISPHDKNIKKSILENLEPWPKSWDTTDLYSSSSSDLLSDPYKQMFSEYYHKLQQTIPDICIGSNVKSNIRFVYSAMHGVGYPFVVEAFKQAKLQPLIPVKEQIEPDPEFPTVKFPNPEEGKSALDLSIQKANAGNVTIILANDPDADRLAVAEKDPQYGQWKVFSGNEIGALLGWWALFLHKENSTATDLSKCYMLASTVSSQILGTLARNEGFKYEETLTGFKWMGNRADKLREEGKEVLFAFEEAIGFMFSTNVLDKDGVSAACQVATLACYLQVKQGMTLSEKLHDLYDKYGLHCTKASYFFCYDEEKIKAIFARIRNFESKQNNYPTSICGGQFKIKNVRDLTTGVDTSQPDGKATLPVSSSSQMITFTFENGLVITLRTSGTEPKIKYYAEMCAQPNDKDWQKIRERLERMVQAVVDEFLQPKENNLVPKAD